MIKKKSGAHSVKSSQTQSRTKRSSVREPDYLSEQDEELFSGAEYDAPYNEADETYSAHYEETPAVSRRERRGSESKKSDAREKREKSEKQEKPRREKRSKREIAEEEPEQLPKVGITTAQLRQETKEESKQRRSKGKKLDGSRIGITVLITVMVAAILAGIVTYLGYSITVSPTNLPNVYVDKLFVGGLTKEQTAAVLDENMWSENAAQPLKVDLLQDVSFEIDMCESGKFLTREQAIEEAYNYGRTKNWVSTFFSYITGLFGQIDVNAAQTSINPDYIRSHVDAALAQLAQVTADNGYTVDEEQSVLVMMKGAGQIGMDADALCSAVTDALDQGLKNISYTTLSAEPKMPDFDSIHKELAIEPVDAYYDYDTKSIVPNIDGFWFDVSEAQNLWNSAAVTDTVTIPVKITVPEVTKESLEALLFRDVLGSMTTNYGTWDTNRVNNLHLALGKIDGIILNPGEIFSYNDTIGERTEEAGFLAAGAYDDGQVVQEIGGGVCQVSSTLYSATIYAQLPARERTNHYFKVDYLDYCMDATVSWPSPNFRFENTRDYPVKIHAYYDDEVGQNVGALTVEILGTDVDGSYVEVWNETWTIPHPEFGDIAYGYSKLQHRVVHAADGTVISVCAPVTENPLGDHYDYLDEYYFHEEVYAEKLAQHRAAAAEGTATVEG